MEDYSIFAVDLAKKAGEMIRNDFQKEIVREWKADDTPITDTDRKVNQLVIDEVEKRFPTHAILSEEGSIPKESEYAWVCDPIDGTVPFSHKYPTSVFSLAFTKQGESLLGVIYDPYMERLLTAQKGEGAYCNKERIVVSEARDLTNVVVDIEAGREKFLYDISELYSVLLKRNCIAVSLRSCVYGGMLTALGEFGGMVGVPLWPWDGAAVKIIVEEAGGKVTDLFGNEQKYNEKIKGVIASNGRLHDALTALVKPLLQKEDVV